MYSMINAALTMSREQTYFLELSGGNWFHAIS